MVFDFKKLGETKVTVPVILIVFVAVVAFKAENFTIAALDEFFFSEAQGEELTKAVEANTAALNTFIRRQEIRDVNDQIDDVQSQISDTELWVAANGSNPIATARMRDLLGRKARLEERKSCLLNDDISDKELCDVN